MIPEVFYCQPCKPVPFQGRAHVNFDVRRLYESIQVHKKYLAYIAGDAAAKKMQDKKILFCS